MNIDELMRQMKDDETGDQEFIRPVAYSKIRPIASPQVYQWIRNGKLGSYTCQCGSKVIRIEEADDLLRALGKLPPKLEGTES
jgi:hypothetical protein